MVDEAMARRPGPTGGVHVPFEPAVVDRRVVLVSLLATALGLVTATTAKLLVLLISAVTQLSFHGRLSAAPASPATNALGPWVIAVPVAGAIAVGLLARFGSHGIRGHGIPEAMEQVLLNRSRIPLRLAWLKPLSAALSIGTGGPFGAEGPIIATGGALGSALGQAVTVTAHERKVLLAAGATAGMAAVFGTPVSAVLLAIELLLFEYRPRSIIPVALASAAAASARIPLFGSRPAFELPVLPSSSGEAMLGYLAVGLLAGVASIAVTRAVYAVEDRFEGLPIHWMWWPALGAIVVGVAGWLEPRSLGVGYDNIEGIAAGRIAGLAMASLCVAKLVSWTIALASGTSGGTLAPLLTVGAGLGAAIGVALDHLWPSLGVDPRMAALVGMAALFAGASRALLASAVFAFEATRQPVGLVPLLVGCASAYLVSALLMRHSIMTEKLARRGGRVLSDYSVDFLDQVLVSTCASYPAVALAADDRLDAVRAWLGSGSPDASHQGYPVVETSGALVGVLTQRDLLDSSVHGAVPVRDLVSREPAVAFEDSSLREAGDHMLRQHVGRLPVVSRDAPRRVLGMLTRSDLLGAHARRVEEAHAPEPGFVLPVRHVRRASTPPGSAGLRSA